MDDSDHESNASSISSYFYASSNGEEDDEISGRQKQRSFVAAGHPGVDDLDPSGRPTTIPMAQPSTVDALSLSTLIAIANNLALRDLRALYDTHPRLRRMIDSNALQFFASYYQHGPISGWVRRGREACGWAPSSAEDGSRDIEKGYGMEDFWTHIKTAFWTSSFSWDKANDVGLIEQSFWSGIFSNDSEMVSTSPLTRYHLLQSAGRRAFAHHGYKLTGMHHFTLLENTICWICVFAPERESDGPIIRRINKKVSSKGQASSASTAIAAADDDDEGKGKEKNNISNNDHRCNCCGVSCCPSHPTSLETVRSRLRELQNLAFTCSYWIHGDPEVLPIYKDYIHNSSVAGSHEPPPRISPDEKLVDIDLATLATLFPPDDPLPPPPPNELDTVQKWYRSIEIQHASREYARQLLLDPDQTTSNPLQIHQRHVSSGTRVPSTLDGTKKEGEEIHQWSYHIRLGWTGFKGVVRVGDSLDKPWDRPYRDPLGWDWPAHLVDLQNRSGKSRNKKWEGGAGAGCTLTVQTMVGAPLGQDGRICAFCKVRLEEHGWKVTNRATAR